MKKYQTLRVRAINFALYHYATQQSFHQSIAEILRQSGLFENNETRELFGLYCQKYEELAKMGKYVPSLLTTTDVQEARKNSDLAFRRLYGDLKALKYDDSPDVADVFTQLEMTVLKQFPVSIVKCRLDLRNQYYSIMASRLEKDWSELINQLGLMPEVEKLQKAVEVFNEAYNQRIEEKAAREKGKSVQLLKELQEIYREIVWYLEAWANNPASESVYRERAEKARSTIQSCNELIGQFHKSMLISASNRRRAK
jgi:hypothetical protein